MGSGGPPRSRAVAELDAFFQRTGYPRAPRYYLIKWLTDWVRELGFDGYRVDTAKHFERVGQRRAEARGGGGAGGLAAGAPRARILGDLPFYMVGEVYGWEVGPRADVRFRRPRRSTSSPTATTPSSTSASSAMPTAPLDSLFTAYAAALHGGPLRGVAVAQLSQLPRRRLAVRRRPEGSARAPALASCSPPAARRSTTATSWRGRSGSRAPRATRTCARS